MHVRITEIEIQGFRALRSRMRLVLRDPREQPLDRVVIAGTNGSGKTSILEAVLLALGREELIVRDLPAERRGDHWRIEVPPGAEIMLHCQVSPRLFQQLPTRFAHQHFTIVRTSKTFTVRGEDGTSENDGAVVRARLKEIPVEYFSSWRAPTLPGGLQPTTAGRQPADNEANRLRRLKQRIINERARRAFVREGSQSEAQDVVWLNQLSHVWQTIHRDGSTIDAGIIDESADEPLFDLFVFDGVNRRCSVDQVSSGELEILTLAGTLLLGRHDGILLIDEPELHLHREWQGQLIKVLAAMAPAAQRIIATHADAPWDQVFSFERFFLAPPGDPRGGTGAT